MRDICLISRDAGHLMKMRDCPSECGTVDTYALYVSVINIVDITSNQLLDVLLLIISSTHSTCGVLCLSSALICHVRHCLVFLQVARHSIPLATEDCDPEGKHLGPR